MKAPRSNSRDRTRKLGRNEAQASPYARLVALVETRAGATLRIAVQPHGRTFLSYEDGDYHVEACGSTTTDAAQALLERLNSETGYLLQPTPPTGATHPPPRRALSR